ncbi:MAG: hypothetical protein GYB67_17920 [Chloroflexi bacterium]|nr:hypothetical protein [Chloroflexota bacterium]
MTRRDAKLRALERHIARLDRRISRLRYRSHLLSYARLLVFVAGVFVTFVAFAVNLNAGWLTLVGSIAVFSGVVYYHRHLERWITRFTIWHDLKVAHFARMTLDWAHLPMALSMPAETDHPFEIDLDLTDEFSLHHLLDTAVAYEGSTRLRDWLLHPLEDHSAIMERQALVRELTPLVTFRDKLSLSARLAARRANRRWRAESVRAWLDKPSNLTGLRPILIVLAGLSAVNITLFILNAAGILPAYWLATFLIYLAVSGTRARDFGTLFADATALQETLRQIQTVFSHLETYHYGQNTRLRALCAPFLGADRPSNQLRRVARIVSAASLQANPFLWGFLNAAIPWDLSFTYLLGRYRQTLSQQLPNWLERWFELEALCALANFADLHPHYTFPQIEPPDAPFVWHSEGLGHPLIPAEQKVCNDFDIAQVGAVALITGSNMAGKSSFLRTVGVNLILAYTGAPVNATRLQVSLLRVYTSIKVSDSLADGFSYFYAEVRRLKALLAALEAAHPIPLFFLIDEIFRGTNNRERLTGSQAYIRALVGKHGVGIISTHDLELVKLADDQPMIRNYHFEDHVVDGRMTFDYRLRTGPSTTTNALQIMQLEGLPVGEH